MWWKGWGRKIITGVLAGPGGKRTLGRLNVDGRGRREIRWVEGRMGLMWLRTEAGGELLQRL
jgi:hypothetical protein